MSDSGAMVRTSSRLTVGGHQSPLVESLEFTTMFKSDLQ